MVQLPRLRRHCAAAQGLHVAQRAPAAERAAVKPAQRVSHCQSNVQRPTKHVPKAVEAKRATGNRRKEVEQPGDERRRGIRLARDHRLCLRTGQHKAELLWAT